MQVFLEKDEPNVLPVPYWTDVEPERRFRNLKREPELAARIPELAGCEELRAFVTRVNAPGSRFATLGCDHWIEPPPSPGIAWEAGLYVDLVFDRLEAATERRRCLDFVERLRDRAAAPASGDPPELTVIRLQLQRVAFAELAPKIAWLVSTWVFGSGRSELEAIDRRARGLGQVEEVCVALSREIAASAGEAGTPVPP